MTAADHADRAGPGVPLAPTALAVCVLGIHLAVIWGKPPLGLLALGTAALIRLVPRMRRGALWAWVAMALLVALALGAAATNRAMELLYLPPIFIPGILGAAFGLSLLPGRTPLVTAIALRLGETRTPELERYTRGVTLAWAIFLPALAIESLTLAALASPQIWSWFANVINYLLLALFFAGELAMRRRILPKQQRVGLAGSVRAWMRRNAQRC